MFVFSKIWRALFTCYLCFEIHPFAISPTMLFIIYSAWIDPRQSIWSKMEKSSKIGRGKRSLSSTFACFLTAVAKVQFMEERLGARLRPHPNLRFF